MVELSDYYNYKYYENEALFIPSISLGNDISVI